MRGLDFSSWHTLLSTLFGLVLITLMGVGVRLMAMQLIQQRRERENRQINERLRTLIAAYKTLGGSFTGNLAVDPTHLGDLRRRSRQLEDEASDPLIDLAEADRPGAERSRRIRDTVEGALSDIILLGTEEQVRLAAAVASELAAGRPAHVHDLVVSLRDFIRKVLDLEPVSPRLAIPKQGPSRPSGGKNGGGKEGGAGAGGGKGGGGGGMGGMGGMGGGMGGMGGFGGDDHGADHH